MTTTDDERREIAERLREYAGDAEFKATCILHDVLMGAGCGSETGDADCEECFSDVIGRLADLIGPERERMCHVEYKCRKGDIWPRAACSVCGHDLSHCDVVEDCGGDAVELCPYCPNCGAKVVAE